ncbi:hypothetical protein EVAR_100875_1 [Eumeta japonica]|uniref:Uncharacterized protein n=1 Tax=Eumeta variegata TaxID=151549 RepID=A0A4C2AFN4_EUMVA|nr:hypothetical protein EVAR_100875_1 [Eumeta japonica]
MPACLCLARVHTHFFARGVLTMSHRALSRTVYRRLLTRLASFEQYGCLIVDPYEKHCVQRFNDKAPSQATVFR